MLGFSKSDLHDNDDSAIDSQLNLTTADEWYTYASRVAFYADKIEDNQNGLCGTTSTKKTDQPSNVEALLNMSLNTARMRHSSRKLKYDETQTLNVITDVKVVRLLVGIPVGSKCFLFFFIYFDIVLVSTHFAITHLCPLCTYS